MVKTNDEDPINFYYYPLIGRVYRKRLLNTLALVDEKSSRLLDIGYGSGLLFPTLSQAADEMHGLETHNREGDVYQMLAKEGINTDKVRLISGSILEMPFQNDFFDSVVSVSTLEHIKDLDQAMSEIKRVLISGGSAVLSFPARNAVTDWFYRLFGFNPRLIHPSSHQDIIEAAKRHFEVEKIIKFPDFKYINFSLYYSIRCIKK